MSLCDGLFRALLTFEVVCTILNIDFSVNALQQVISAVEVT